MNDYLKQLKLRRDFLRLEKERLEKSLIPVVKELKTVESLIAISGGGEAFPRDGSIRDKIIFILKEIKQGSFMDIANSIEKHGETVNLISLKITCSNLANEGVLKVVGSSKRSNIYSL